MKISDAECQRAVHLGYSREARILPEGGAEGFVRVRESLRKEASPLERGMVIAEKALASVPETREDVVQMLKAKVERGEYDVSGEEIADMMLRRLSADKIR